MVHSPALPNIDAKTKTKSILPIPLKLLSLPKEKEAGLLQNTLTAGKKFIEKNNIFNK